MICQYCKQEDGSHDKLCPTQFATNPTWAMKEWNDGVRAAEEGRIILGIYLARHYSVYFVRAYEQTRDQIEKEIDVAAQWQCSFHNGEY